MRALHTLIVVVTLSAVLMTFEPVRQYGVSLFASAGVAGLIAGLAARPLLTNLIAGIQIATTQPIRIGDQVVVENESGRIEEITSTYVVIRLWDLRRMIVPLSYFIEKPFQNWTLESSNLLGTVTLYVDFTAPVDAIRNKLGEIVKGSKLWDGNVVKLQVTDAKEGAMELRAPVSARSAADAFELRCDVREKLIEFLRTEYPTVLPRARRDGTVATGSARARAPGAARGPQWSTLSNASLAGWATAPSRRTGGEVGILRLCSPTEGSPGRRIEQRGASDSRRPGDRWVHKSARMQEKAHAARKSIVKARGSAHADVNRRHRLGRNAEAGRQ
jgi:Mechanosensitive ion channel, beta-domain